MSINYEVIAVYSQLLHRYALICSNSGPNFKAIHQMSYIDFKKCCETVWQIANTHPLKYKDYIIITSHVVQYQKTISRVYITYAILHFLDIMKIATWTIFQESSSAELWVSISQTFT